MSDEVRISMKAVTNLAIQIFAFGVLCQGLKVMGLVAVPNLFAVVIAGFLFTLGVNAAITFAQSLSANNWQMLVVFSLGVAVALFALPSLRLIEFSGMQAFLVAWVLACIMDVFIAYLNEWIGATT